MKHSQYKHWILGGADLDADQRNKLAEHLAACTECRQLKSGWEASLALLTNPIQASPAPGFTDRWQTTLVRKTRLEKVRRYRLSVAGFILLGFFATLIYLTASGSFMHVLATSFNAFAQFAIAIARGLSALGTWLGRLPIAVPLAAGFMLFGLLTAFLMAVVFALWNIDNQKKPAHETISN